MYCNRETHTGAFDSYFMSVFLTEFAAFDVDLITGFCGSAGDGGGGCESTFLDKTSFLSSFTDDNPRLIMAKVYYMKVSTTHSD